ncbi:hypothetical protein RHOER0001_3211 [Rhodococcus erythropolis SK121]|nr:hypothetical protein RHOER0001_3211 [Rhodococcus erythropolis SK121]
MAGRAASDFMVTSGDSLADRDDLWAVLERKTANRLSTPQVNCEIATNRGR